MAFEKLLGQDRFQNLVFVTTKWKQNPLDEASRKEHRDQNDREAQLIDSYWKKMIERGSEVRRHDGTQKSARLMIQILMNKPNLTPTEDYEEKLRSLYSEPAPANEPEQGPGPGPGRSDEKSQTDAPRASLALKLSWTAFRCYSAIMCLFFAYACIYELSHDSQDMSIFLYWALLCAVLGIAVQWFQPSLWSLGSLVYLYGFWIFIMISNEVRDFNEGLLVSAISSPALAMTYVYWLYQPHTSDMYFF